jgi:short-chain fatty acids transporter
LGLTSSAALIMASPDSLPASVLQISGVIPLSQTLGLWQSVLVAAILMAVSTLIAYYSAPAESEARGMEEEVGQAPGLGGASGPPANARNHPGEWLEYSPALTLVVSAMGAAYLATEVANKSPGILLELNHYIFAFLILGMLFHWRPRSFVQAISKAVPSAAGVFIQYPLYAGVVRIMTESGLASEMAKFFVEVSTRQTFPVLVGIYSAFLGLFVPSAGGKWIVEAPYVLGAAKSLGVHLGWVVQTYNATEALANLIHPFWMLPLVGILGLKARDIIGYSMLQFAVHVPVVLFLVWILNYTLVYVAPVLR